MKQFIFDAIKRRKQFIGKEQQKLVFKLVLMIFLKNIHLKHFLKG